MSAPTSSIAVFLCPHLERLSLSTARRSSFSRSTPLTSRSPFKGAQHRFISTTSPRSSPKLATPPQAATASNPTTPTSVRPSPSTLPKKPASASLSASSPTQTQKSPSPIPSPSSPSAASQTPTQSQSSSPPQQQQPHRPLPYHVHRTPSQHLPVYHLRKNGGNLHQTLIRKVSGESNALRKELVRELKIPNDKIKVNNVNGHVVIKVRFRLLISDCYV